MKIKTLILSLLLCTNAYSASDYYTIISKEHNKFEDKKVITVPKTGNVCKIEFTELNAPSHITLSQMQVNTPNGAYDFGGILSKVGKENVYFENATVKVNNVYNNSNYYYTEYAIRGYEGEYEHTKYWLTSLANSFYKIEFPEGIEVTSFEYSDWGRASHYTNSYNLNIYNCDNEILKTEIVTNRLANFHNDIITVDL